VTNLKKRIAVLHTSLNGAGGAEKLALTLIEGLKEQGFEVELITIEATDWKKISRVFKFKGNDVKEIHIPPFKAMPTMYAKFLNWLSLGILAPITLRKRYDLTILTNSLPLPTLVDIHYLHFPDFLPTFTRIYHPKYLNPVLAAYLTPHDALVNFLTKIARSIERKPLLLTNSRFSRLVIKRFLGLESTVVYPPVDVEKYLPLSRIKYRKNIVVTISRIEEDKHLETIVEVAKAIKDAKFVIIGTTRQVGYLHMLKSKAKNVNVNDRLILLPNASEELKTEIMSKAKIYLHSMKFEHFGIAVVEAMSAGIVPVVHKSGGPWMDLLEEKQGEVGYAYTDVDEATQIIKELLINDKLRFEIVKKATERAKTFSKNIFKIKMINYIKQVLLHL